MLSQLAKGLPLFGRHDNVYEAPTEHTLCSNISAHPSGRLNNPNINDGHKGILDEWHQSHCLHMVMKRVAGGDQTLTAWVQCVLWYGLKEAPCVLL